MGTTLPDRDTPRFPNNRNTYTRRDGGYFSGPYGTELRSAIDRVYAAFADAPLSEPLDACMHCFTQSDVQYLRTTPLRSLSHGDMSLIATKLISTLGAPEDVAYFTPRIVEALAEGALIELEPFADRLAKMPLGLWTNDRTAALAESFRLLFAATGGTCDDLGMDDTRDHLRRALPRLFERGDK